MLSPRLAHLRSAPALAWAPAAHAAIPTGYHRFCRLKGGRLRGCAERGGGHRVGGPFTIKVGKRRGRDGEVEVALGAQTRGRTGPTRSLRLRAFGFSLPWRKPRSGMALKVGKPPGDVAAFAAVASNLHHGFVFGGVAHRAAVAFAFRSQGPSAAKRQDCRGRGRSLNPCAMSAQRAGEAVAALFGVAPPFQGRPHQSLFRPNGA
jgi:hypothetical protein